ncbi:MAG TPA: aminotransferase class V-fold PLP-dependent enzyme [Longimicrobiales bacterium]
MDPKLTRWRIETPAAAAGLVHLNNAGASLMPLPVLEAIEAHLAAETRCGGYEAAHAAAGDIAAAYEALARLLGAGRRNVAVVENATTAIALALSAFDFHPGDRIVTSRGDYVSNQIMYLSLARRLGVEVVRAADLPEGGVDPQSVREILRRRPATLVALTWVPTNSGLVQPAEEVGTICAEAGVPFVLDACQAVGQLPVDVKRLHCAFLGATARKFLRGPRGIGFLYVSDDALAAGRAPLYVDMRGARWQAADEYALVEDARRFENWEFAEALRLGMGEAVRYALEVGIEEGGRRAAELAAYARHRLGDIEGIRVLDRGERLCAIVTAEIAGRKAQDVVLELREWGINTSATTRDDALLDMDEKGVVSAVRISPHYYNTQKEIDTCVAALRGLAGG